MIVAIQYEIREWFHVVASYHVVARLATVQCLHVLNHFPITTVPCLRLPIPDMNACVAHSKECFVLPWSEVLQFHGEKWLLLGSRKQ